jgi:predicted N-acetyltransferase YhbS
MLGRLVVAKPARGQGLAEALDRVRIERALALGAQAVVGLAAPYRAPALQRLGFSVLGECAPPVAFLDGRPAVLMAATASELRKTCG